MMVMINLMNVIPAQAGIHFMVIEASQWIPACAGMTGNLLNQIFCTVVYSLRRRVKKPQSFPD